METVALIVALLLGLGFFAMFASAFIESLRSRNWSRVRGTITSAWVGESRSSESGASFAPEVRYTYEYEGRKFTGNQLAAVNVGARHRGYAKQVLERYPIGAEVDVYVNPLKPSRAVLQIGVSWASVLAMAFGLAVATFAIVMLSRGDS